MRRAAQEVHLPADAATKLSADRVRTHLSSQVDLQRRVDRHHVVVAGNQQRVVSVSVGVELEDWVVVHEVEKPLRPKHEGQNYLARLEVLARAGHYFRFD